MKRIYLAGPISLGDTCSPEQVQANLKRFHDAAARLRALGFHVENPAENQDSEPPLTWAGWMRLAIAQLVTCDVICLLPDWTRSRGAKIEHDLAATLEIERKEFDAWITWLERKVTA